MRLTCEPCLLNINDATSGSAEVIDANQASDQSDKESNEKELTNDKELKEEKPSFELYTFDSGIWRIFYEKPKWNFIPGPDFVKELKEIINTFPYIWRFMIEVWSFAPGQLLLWALLSLWEPVDATISLWVSAVVYDTVSQLRIIIHHMQKVSRY